MDLIVLMGEDPQEVEVLAAGIAAASPHTIYRKSIQDFIKATTMRRFGLADDFWKGIEDENEPMYEFGARTAQECYEETEARGRELDRYFWVRLWLEALEYEAIALPDNTQVIFDNLTHEDDLDYLLGNFGHSSILFSCGPLLSFQDDLINPRTRREKIASVAIRRSCNIKDLSKFSSGCIDVFITYYKSKLAKRAA